MSARKVEQFCQTSGSLGSLPAYDIIYDDDDASHHAADNNSSRRVAAALGFRIVSDDDEDNGGHGSRSSNGSGHDDYDEVATDVDNSSLHFTLEELERSADKHGQASAGGGGPTAGAAVRLGFVDALPQVCAALIANLLPMQAGINMAYSAFLIPQLSDPLADIPIDKDEASWIGGSKTQYR